MAPAAQPSVSLKAMTEAEFPRWREIAIEQHAAQVSRATGKALQAAVDESRQVLAQVLPMGLASENMDLFVVTNESQREIGWLWLGPSPRDAGAGFVFDIIIESSHRGRGYGRATMLAAERFFLAQGRSRVGLDVAGGNEIARALYESIGYLPISTAMSKRLGPD
jgi:ribosomal protein S18 acetylase RimI-like enzyme